MSERFRPFYETVFATVSSKAFYDAGSREESQVRQVRSMLKAEKKSDRHIAVTSRTASTLHAT